MNENYRPGQRSGNLPTYGQFAQCISTKFYTSLESGIKVALILSGISKKENKAGYDNFSLYFTGDPDILLPQSIYTLEHLLFEPLDLLLVPIGKEKWGNIYETVFGGLSEGG